MESSEYTPTEYSPATARPKGPIHPGSGRARKLTAPLGGAALLAAKFGAKMKALLILLPLSAALMIWFGVAKIRLRDKLGARAALLGWMEIVMVILFAGLLTWFLYSRTVAPQQDKKVQVVVASRDLPLGTLLRRQDLRMAPHLEREIHA